MTHGSAIPTSPSPPEECDHEWWEAGEENPNKQQCRICWRYRPAPSADIVAVPREWLREVERMVRFSDPTISAEIDRLLHQHPPHVVNKSGEQ